MTSSSLVRQKVALLGAFDRFNYGDLLFPILVENEIRQRSPDTETSIFSLVKSDLTRFGARKTRSLRALYGRGEVRPNDIIIFAGGGTIGVDWVYMHQNLLGRMGNQMLYAFQRLFGDRAANLMSQWYFGARAPFPWVASSEDFPVPVNIAYNAVGGSELARLPSNVREGTLDRLAKATYLSVRDAETKRQLISIEDRIAVELAPDSAVIMSEQFPLGILKDRASHSVLEQIGGEPYVCFQSNLHYARLFEEKIINKLEAIYEHHGLRALLLPIGRYVGLDDQIGLQSILERLRTPAAIVTDQASLWDIMLTIAQARLFIGTSLHGNVTSQSFAVPHIGLSDRLCKLDFYLNTWDLPEQSTCSSLDEIIPRVDKVLAVPEKSRVEKRTELIACAQKNFSKLAHACGLTWYGPEPIYNKA